jgi:hypothetical protein
VSDFAIALRAGVFTLEIHPKKTYNASALTFIPAEGKK